MLSGCNSDQPRGRGFAAKGMPAVDAIADGPYGNWMPFRRAGAMGTCATWWCRCIALLPSGEQCGHEEILDRKRMKRARHTNAKTCHACRWRKEKAA